MMSHVDRERLLRRLDLCRKELRRAKAMLCFWSEEIRLVVDAISDDKQFNFDKYLNGEIGEKQS